MNQITVNFDTCSPAPVNGYNILWRQKNSALAYMNAGNFASSPAVFTDDSAYPNGTEFEGYVRSDCGTSFGAPVYWTTNQDCSSCNTFISQITADPRYVDLGEFILHTECATSVSLRWEVVTRPNRFTVYDNGAVISSSGWVGYAPYSGNWGQTLPQTALVGFINYNPVIGHVYTVRVEAGPSGPIPFNVDDNFLVEINCTI